MANICKLLDAYAPDVEARPGHGPARRGIALRALAEGPNYLG